MDAKAHTLKAALIPIYGLKDTPKFLYMDSTVYVYGHNTLRATTHSCIPIYGVKDTATFPSIGSKVRLHF